MEKAIGIVSEFNPFHSGHQYLLSEVKKAFPQKGLVCIMSGNFVQRGSFAIQEKYSRAKCAVLAGADLVLELPFPFSSLSSETFSSSAISILHRIGICSHLAFGTEIDEKKELRLAAERILETKFQSELQNYLSSHPQIGFPKGREEVYQKMYGESKIFSSPNASLAVQYLAAAKKEGFEIDFYPVSRKGEGYSSLSQEGEHLSATAIRKMILQGDSPSAYLSPETISEMESERKEGRFPVSEESLYPILQYQIQTKSREELSEYYALAAVCDRVKRFAPESNSWEELIQKTKDASVTDSRIRRALLSLLLSIPRFAEKEVPAYSMVLAASAKGREMLSEIKEFGSIPVFTKPAHAKKSESEEVQKQFLAAKLSDDIYQMAFKVPQKAAYFLKKSPYIE